jgi:regulator of replication initiation timing
MTAQEKEIKDLKEDLKAAREETKKYLEELHPLRQENKRLKENIKILQWQLDLVQKAVATRFE